MGETCNEERRSTCKQGFQLCRNRSWNRRNSHLVGEAEGRDLVEQLAGVTLEEKERLELTPDRRVIPVLAKDISWVELAINEMETKHPRSDGLANAMKR